MILEDRREKALSGVGALEFRFQNPTEIQNWDDIVGAHPNATVFHSRAWATLLQSSYRYKPCYAVGFEGDRIRGILPLFEVNSWVTGRRGVSIPFTDRCSALLFGSSCERLFEGARDFGGKRGWKSLELRGVALEFAPASSVFHQHDLDLRPSETELFERCDPAMRRAIRKAEKAGVTVASHSTLDAVEIYYGMHQLVRQKHGVPPQSFSFFRHLWESVIRKGQGTVLLGYLKERPVAGAVFLNFGKHSVYKFGASDPAFQETRPNNLLLWNGILEMKSLGAETLSFGRSSVDQEGLCRFKRSFGASESPLYYAKYLYKTSQFSKRKPDGPNTLVSGIFRLCPKPIARILGTLLYPHVG